MMISKKSLFVFYLIFMFFLAHAQEKQKPNIVFFLIDDLGWSDLGCYGSDEFMFELNGDKITGNKEDKHFTFLDHTIQEGENQSEILKVHLKRQSNTAARETELFIYYQVYQDLACVRKLMERVNTGKKEKVLNNLAWEKIRFHQQLYYKP